MIAFVCIISHDSRLANRAPHCIGRWAYFWFMEKVFAALSINESSILDPLVILKWKHMH